MNFSRVSGGKISRYDLKHQKSVKDHYPVKYNQKKVGRTSCNNHLRRSNSEHYKINDPKIIKKIQKIQKIQIGTLDHISDTSMKSNGKKSDYSDPDKLPQLFSKVTNRGINAKSAEEARGALKNYFQLLRKTYSREVPPSIKIREHLYNNVVRLSAKIMSFEFTPDLDKDKEKTLGLTAELLQQMLSGLEASSAEFVNSQVTAVLSLGMMTPEDKEFLFGSCLNTQIISVDKYTVDIMNLDNKISKLDTKLTGTKQSEQGEEEEEDLKCRIESAGIERADLVRKYERLVSQEMEGMHGQKEFFQSCYEIMINQVRSEIRAGFKKQLKQKIKINYDEGMKLVNRIMRKMDSTLRSKAESIAKNVANQKKGVQAEDVYQEKKLDLFLVLSEEASRLLVEVKKRSSDLKSMHMHKNDTPRPVYNINDKAIAIDPEPEKLDIDDVFLPINKQAEEWGEILLKQLPDSMRESVDVKDLTRCLDEKASEMDIRGDLVLPDSPESPFARKSASCIAVRRKKESKANKLPTSVTELLKEAVVKQGQNMKAPAATQSVDLKKQCVDLIKFFEDVIGQHRIEV